jgi:hypothetical protein
MGTPYTNSTPYITIPTTSSIYLGIQNTYQQSPFITAASLIDSTVNYAPAAWTDPDSNRTKSFYVGGGGQIGSSAVTSMFYQRGLPFSTLFNMTSTVSTCFPSFPFTTSVVNGLDGLFMTNLYASGARNLFLTRGRTTWSVLGRYINGTTPGTWNTNLMYSLDGQNWIKSVSGYGMEGYEIRYFQDDDIFIATGSPNPANNTIGSYVPTYFYSADAVTWSNAYLTSTMTVGGRGLSSIFYTVTYTSTLANPFYFALGFFTSNVNQTATGQVSTIVTGWITSSIRDPSSWRQRTLPVTIRTGSFTYVPTKWNMEWLGRSWVITNCNLANAYSFDSSFNLITPGNTIPTNSYSPVVTPDYSQVLFYDESGAYIYPIVNGSLAGQLNSFVTNSFVSPFINIAFWDVNRFVFLSDTKLYTISGTIATDRGVIPGLIGTSYYFYAASWNLQYGLAIADAPSTVTGFWQFSTPMLSIPTTDGWSTLRVSNTNALLIPDTTSVKFRYVIGRPSTSIQTLTAYPWDTTQFTPFTTINPTLINAATNVSSAISTTPVYFTLSTIFFPYTPFLSSSAGQHNTTFSLSSIYGTGFNNITNTSSLVGNSMGELYRLYLPYYRDINSNAYSATGPLISSFVLTDLPTIPNASWFLTSSLSGPSWSLLETPITPSTSFTLSIHPSTRIALYTSTNIASTYTLKLRMANASDGAPFFSTVDTSYLNDPSYSYLYLSSPYTLSSVNLQIQVLYANIPPYFSTSGLFSFLSTTSLEASTIVYTTSSFVSTIQGLTPWIDGDSTAYTPSTGLVITQASSTIIGSWQYSTPSQSIVGGWSTIIASPTAALTLPISSIVSLRFIQRGNSTSVQSITVIPWDQSAYAPYRTINTTLQNFSSAISSTPFTFTMSTLFFPYPAYLSSAGQHASTTNVLSVYDTGVSPLTNLPGIFGVTTSSIFGLYRPYFYDVTSPVYNPSLYTSTLVLTDLQPVENATWYITSSITGPSWSVLPTPITPSTSLLLPINTSTQIALYTSTLQQSTYTFTMRAGNRTDLAPYFSTVDTSFLNDPSYSYLYISSPYTLSTINARVTVLHVNNTPYLTIPTTSTFTFPDPLAVKQLAPSTFSFSISSMVDTIRNFSPGNTSWVDVDSAIFVPSTGFAIVSAPSTTTGSWQYSTSTQAIPGGWSTLRVAPTGALLVPNSSTIFLRYNQIANSTSVQSLTVIPWDQTAYAPFQTINTTLQNFSSAISSTPFTFTLSTLFFPYQPYLSSAGQHVSTTNVHSVYANGFSPLTNTTGIFGVTTSTIFGRYRPYFYDISQSIYTAQLYTSTLVLTDLQPVENATWYITSSITGPNWSVLPTPITPSTSLLLPINTSTQLSLFTTNNIQTSTYTFSMRLGNRTDLAPYFSIVDTSYLDDPSYSYLYLSSPYTTSTIRPQITALHINNTPFLTIPTTSSLTFDSTLYGVQTSGFAIPFSISSMVGLVQNFSPGDVSWVDLDSNYYIPSTGFAIITAPSTATGAWQYSTPTQNIVGGWSTFLVSPSAALLVPNLSTAFLRYAQGANSTSVQSITVIPWDQATGSAFRLINTLTSNYSTSISSTPFTFRLSTFVYKPPPYLSSVGGQHASTLFMSSIFGNGVLLSLDGNSMADFYNFYKPYYFDVKAASDTRIYGSTMVLTSLPTIPQGAWYFTSSVNALNWSPLPTITPSTAFTIPISRWNDIALYTTYDIQSTYTLKLRMGNGADAAPPFSTIDLSFLENPIASDPRVINSAYTFSTMNLAINVNYANAPPTFSTVSTLNGGIMYYGKDNVNYGILTGASIVDTILKSNPNAWNDYDIVQPKKIYYAGGTNSGTTFYLGYQQVFPISSLYTLANTAYMYPTNQTFTGTPTLGIPFFNCTETDNRGSFRYLMARGRTTTIILSKYVDNNLTGWNTSHAYSMDGSNWAVSLAKTGLTGYEAKYFADDDIFITTGYPRVIDDSSIYRSSISYLYSRDGISWTRAIVSGNNGTQNISTVFYSLTYTSSATYKATGKAPFYFAIGIPVTTLTLTPSVTTATGPVAGWVTSSIWDPSSWRYQTLPASLPNDTARFYKWSVAWLGNSFLVTTSFGSANPSSAYFDTSFNNINTNVYGVNTSYEPAINDDFTYMFAYNTAASYIYPIVDGKLGAIYQIGNQTGFPPSAGQVIWDDSRFLSLTGTNLFAINPVTKNITQLSATIPTGVNGSSWPYFHVASWTLQRGIAIRAATTTNLGSWYYSTNINATNWTSFNTLTYSNAIVFPDSHAFTFQFQSSRASTTIQSLTVYPWDMTEYRPLKMIDFYPTAKYAAITQDTGYSGYSMVAYSYDGIGWYKRTNKLFNSEPSVYDNCIVSNGSNLMLSLGYNTTDTGSIKYSYNGGITNDSINNGGFTSKPADAAWNGSMWVAVGQHNAKIGSIQYSYDGIRWIKVSGFDLNTYLGSAYGSCVIWNGSMWVACGGCNVTGSTGGTSTGTILYSYNGINWNTITQGGFKTSANKIVWNGSNQFLALGSNDTTSTRTIQYSSDGITWYNASTTYQTGTTMAVWNGSNLWVAVGPSPQGIIYSSDGINWLPGNNVSILGNHIAYNGSNLWVATGRTNTNAPIGSIQYSSDGINWNNNINGGFNEGYNILWNGSNMWIASGDYGFQSIQYSYNASEWFYASTLAFFNDTKGKLGRTYKVIMTNNNIPYNLNNISSSVSYTPVSIQISTIIFPYQPFLAAGYPTPLTLSSVYTTGFDALTQTQLIRGTSFSNLYSVYRTYFNTYSLPYPSSFVLTNVPNIPNHTWFITSSITGLSWSPLPTPITATNSFVVDTNRSTQIALYTSTGLVSTYTLTARMGYVTEPSIFFSTVDTSYLLNSQGIPYLSSPYTQSTISLTISVLYANTPSFFSTSGLSTSLGVTKVLNGGYIVDTSTLVGSIASNTAWVDGTSNVPKSMYFGAGGTSFSYQVGLPIANSLTTFANNISLTNVAYTDVLGTYGRFFAKGRTTFVTLPVYVNTSANGGFGGYSFNGTTWYGHSNYPTSVIVPGLSYVQQNNFEVRYFSANDIFIACGYNRGDPSWSPTYPMFSPTYYYSQTGITWKAGFLTSTLGTANLSSIFYGVTLGSNESYANGNPFYLAIGVLVKNNTSNTFNITNISSGVMAWRTSSILNPSSWQQFNLPSVFTSATGNPGALYTRPSTVTDVSTAPKWNISWLGNSWLLTHFLYPGALYLHSTMTTGQVLYTTPVFNPAPTAGNGFYEPVLNSTGTFALLPGNNTPLYGFNISSGILTDTTANVFSTVGGALSSIRRNWRGGVTWDRSNFIAFSSTTEFIGTSTFFTSSIGSIPTGGDGSTWLSLHSFPYQTQRGLAITQADVTTMGSWQISTPRFAWSTIKPTPTNAVLLPESADHLFRFNYTTPSTSVQNFTVIPWDVTQYQPFQAVNTTALNFSTSISTTPFTFSISTIRPLSSPMISTGAIAYFSTQRGDNINPSIVNLSSFILSLSSSQFYREGITGDPRGLLLTSTSAQTIGIWQFTTATIPWTTIPPVSESSALGLFDSPTTLLTFSTLLNVNSRVSLYFKAWNRLDNLPEGSLVDTSMQSDGTTYSASSLIVYLSTVRVNVAPTLPPTQTIQLANINADSTNMLYYTTYQLSTLLTTSWTDPDATRGYPKTAGIAITDSPYGTTGYWQISTPTFTTSAAGWSTINTITPANAYILPFSSIYALRFVPASNFTSTYTLDFRTWTSDAYGALSTVNLTAANTVGASTSFSFYTNTIAITATQANRRPYLQTTTTVQGSTIYADNSQPIETSIYSLVAALGTNYQDLDLAIPELGNIKGLALTYAPYTTAGYFQISTVSLNWTTLTTPISTNTAVLLGSTSYLKFIPTYNITSSYTLKFRLWDGTDNNPEGLAGVATQYADSPSLSLSSAYSYSTFSLPFSTAFINHAPSIPEAQVYTLPNVMGANVLTNTLTTAYISSLIGPVYYDVDFATGQRQGLALVYTNSTAVSYWQLSTTRNAWSTLGGISTTNSLMLDISFSTILRWVLKDTVATSTQLNFLLWDRSKYGQLSSVTILDDTQTAFSTPFSYITSSVTLFQNSVAVNNSPFIKRNTNAITVYLSSIYGPGLNLDLTAPNSAIPTTQFSTLISTQYGELNSSDARGFALIYASQQTTGQWLFSNVSMTSFSTIPFYVSTNAAITAALSPTTSFVFSTSATANLANTTASLRFRLWDQTDSIPNGSLVNTSYMDAPPANFMFSTPYSQSSFAVAINLLRINCAPVLSSGTTLALSNVNASDLNPRALPISTMLIAFQPYYTDLNTTDRRGIAITRALSTSMGFWQVSTPRIAAFSTLHLISDAQPSLFLASTASLRFVPKLNVTSTVSLEFRAWDQTVYDSLSTATTAFASPPTNFLSTSYSYSTATLQFIVRSVNNAPTLASTVRFALSSQYSFYDPGYTGALANTYGNSITDLFNIMGTNYRDLDTSDTKGIAILGFSTLQGTGAWYYTSTTQGTLQQTPLTQIQRALLLNQASIRFVPSINSTFTASFTARIWDESDTLPNNTSNYDLRFMEPPTNLSTAYSFSTVTFTVQNTRYNFAPAISTSTEVSLSNLEAIALNPPALSVSSLLTAIQGQTSDLNLDDRRGIAITYAPSTAMGLWQISTSQIAAFSTLHLTSDSQPSLFLTSTATFRFLPKLNVTSTVSLLFRVWDQTAYGSLSTATTAFASPPDRFLSTSYSYSTAAVSFNLFHVNNAPTLASTVKFALSTQYSISPSPLDPAYGTSVTDLFNQIASNYRDVDPLDGKGVALIGLSTLQGTGSWYVGSTLQGNGQPFLQSMPPISIQSAFLLDASLTNRIVFLPTRNSTFQTSLTFRVWDQTDALPSFTSNYDLRFMESPTNVSTAYSFSTVTFTLQSSRYNFAPAISTSTAVSLSNVLGNDTNPPAFSFQTVLASIQAQTSDQNTDDRLGLAITRAVSTSIGYWQISTPQIATFSTLNIRSDVESLFLTSTASLRFVPGMNSNSTVSLAFRLWDRTAYDSLSTASTAFQTDPSPITFLSTPYSYSTALLYFSVSHVNHAPWITTSSIQTRIGLTSSFFQEPAYKGDSVFSILSALSTNYNERDEGDRRGIALVGTTQTEIQGQWQLSSLTQNWTAIPSPISESSALLLSSLTTSFLRFSTGINLNGSATLTFRLWDGYDGFPDATYPYSITATGGTTSYSSNTVIGTTNFYSVNRAPVLDSSTIVMGSTVYGDTNPAYSYNTFQFTRLTNLFTPLDANGWYTDIDVSPQRGIGIVYAPSTSAGAWQISRNIIQQPPSWSNLHILSTNSTFLMARENTTAIRFLPGLNVASTYTMKFVAWDQTGPETNLTFTNLTQAGGQTPFSLSSGSFYVSTLYVNAAPVLEANTNFFMSPPTLCIDTSFPNLGLTVSSILSSISSAFSDPNPSSLRGIALTLNTIPTSVGSLQLSYTDRTNPNFLNSFSNLPSIPTATNSFLIPYGGEGNPSPSSLSIRFAPAPSFNRTSTFVFPFRAWDQTDGYGFTTLDTTKNGLSTSVSVNEGYLLFSTVQINQPPILIQGTNVSLPLLEGFITPSQSITTADFLESIASQATFPNTIDQPGLALFNAGQGSWQVYTPSFPDDGWSTIPIGYAMTGIQYYLLPRSTTTKIRFIAPTNATSLYSVNYVLWNQTAYTPFTQTTIAANVSTPISQATGTLQIQTSRINYPPVISTGTYQGGTFNGNNVGNTGITVNTLIDSFFDYRDLNTDDGKGIAIRGYTANYLSDYGYTADGVLQYKRFSDASWTNIYLGQGFVDRTNAFVLPYDPVNPYSVRVSTLSNTYANYNVEVYGWDRTRGTSLTFNSIASLQTVSPEKGSLSYDQTKQVLQSSFIQFSNSFVFHSPVLLNDVMIPSYSAIPRDNDGYSISSIIGYLGNQYIDPNLGQYGTGRGLALIGLSPNDATGAWEYSLNAGSTWSSIQSTTTNLQTASLLLKGSGSTGINNKIRFKPATNQTYSNVQFSFIAWDERYFSNGSTHFITISEQGGINTFSEENATCYFNIQQVYYAPSTTAYIANVASMYSDNTSNTNSYEPSIGLSVRTILYTPSFGYDDPNVGLNTQRGMAITSGSIIQGRWQYRQGNSQQWVSINAYVNETTSTLLLPEDSYIRFNNVTAASSVASLTWLAWSPFQETAYTYVSSATTRGPNGPFSAKSQAAPYIPTLTMNIVLAPSPPSIGPWVDMISYPINVSYDPSKNTPVPLTTLLSRTGVNYIDSYTPNIQGFIITPIAVDGVSTTIKGVFTNSLNSAVTCSAPGSMLVYTTTGVYPTISFTADQSDTTMNKYGIVSFQVRGWNGGPLSIGSPAPANGTILQSPIPPFTIHGSFSETVLTYGIQLERSGTAPAFEVAEAYVPPPIVDGTATTTITFIDTDSVYNSMNILN